MTVAAPFMADGFTRVFGLALPPDRVWRALTERDEMQAWFAPVMGSVDVRPGGRIFFGDTAPDEVECEVLEAQPHRRLRWVERGSVLPGPIDITITLEPADDGGTRVLFSEARAHDGSPAGPAWSWRDELLEVERAVADLRAHLAR
jgi:uncharacterized protein YndB with AHSA1/START domain